MTIFTILVSLLYNVLGFVNEVTSRYSATTLNSLISNTGRLSKDTSDNYQPAVNFIFTYELEV